MHLQVEEHNFGGGHGWCCRGYVGGRHAGVGARADDDGVVSVVIHADQGDSAGCLIVCRQVGGQHACLVADSLAIKRILIHPYAGVLSAYGMGLADTVISRQHAVETVLTSSSYQDLTRVV